MLAGEAPPTGGVALATLVSSGANVLLLDEPTNNLDPVPRGEVLAAVAAYPGAVITVSHDEEAVEALRPQRVLLLPYPVEELRMRRMMAAASSGLRSSQSVRCWRTTSWT